MCDSLHIEPKQNNGTLRLPLKPIGLHKPEGGVEEPADPVSSYTLPAAPSTPSPAGTSPPVGVDTVEVKPTSSHPITVDPVGLKPTATRPITVNPAPSQPTDQAAGDGGSDDTGAEGNDEKPKKGLWGWFTDKIEEIWDKITGSK